MDGNLQLAKRTFWMVSLFGLFIGIALSAGGYWGLDRISSTFFMPDGSFANEVDSKWFFSQIEYFQANFYKIVLPSITAAVFLIFFVLWVLLRFVLNVPHATVERKKSADHSKAKKDFVDQKIEQDRKRRLFLHMLSVLQREGRLLDFFHEDLSLYDDDQIGAAVRSIHEDCSKAVKKYIAPRPVLETAEGEQITIETGFDIDAVKLVGNVSGKPPFNGIVKHGGWKAGKNDVPRLSDIQDAGIITPAEVEIV